MVRVQFCAFYWSLFVMGLFYTLRQCDARAVNVSNSWTMPQEGLNVFYRFFRDRISWFEADAVCQFHHANLVTVDNSFQFDGTRDLLRELDVNDIVWIGLMRPQSSERFMWSNSKPLVADTGYWAESLPLMDAPLCAVIDPIRDYRWHALRCGGPETASFLCEMPVPNWAEACIIKDMPNLTIQYMADTASVQLIRNCQEEGLLRAACKGKQDRSQVSETLICPRERLETQRINDITNSHFKSLQIIDGISTDNNENNNIELLPMEASYGSNAPLIVYPQNVPTEKNAVQRLIEQFNVDELMEAAEPKIQIQNINDFYKLNAPIPKPVKKSAKSLSELSKKDTTKQKSKSDREETDEEAHFKKNMEDMMMGDQPMGEPEMAENILNDVVSNELMEHLPHTKKVMPQDLHTMAIIQEKLKKNREGKYAIVVETATISTPDTLSDKVSSKDNKKVSSIKHKEHTTHDSSIVQQEQQIPTIYSTAVIMPQVTSSTLGTITHPIHPQPQLQSHYQPPPPPNNEQSPRTVHIKETPNNSHFIPPMLLVKSHYVPNSKHGHTTIHGDYHNDRLSNDDNEKVFELPEQRSTTLSTELSQSNLVKTAVTTFQNMDDTTKLIVNGSQQKITANLEVVAEQETNRSKHDNNNKNAGIVAVTVPGVRDEMKLSTTLQTIKPKTTQHQQQQQIKLNLDESIQSTADGADLQKIISQQNQQQRHDDTNKSSATNIEADTAQLMVETTKSTITTEKMHDLVEGKLNKDSRNAPNTQIPKTEIDKITGKEMMSGVEPVVQTTIRSTITAPPTTMITTTTTKLVEAHKKQKEYNEQQQQLALTTSPEVQTKSQRKPTTAEVTETEIHTKQKNTDTREISATTQNQPTDSFVTITEKRTQIGDGDRKVTMQQTETIAAATMAPTADAGINIKDTITSSKQEAQHIMYVAGEESTEEKETLNIKQRAATTTNNAQPTFSALTTFIYSTTPPTTTRNFLKVTTEQPYKPNRRRSLTKPETVSYIKKILG